MPPSTNALSLAQNKWSDKISNSAQLGGIETSTLNNGTGRGTRIAWINTGTGLRYKVIIDRAMDIADAFYNECSIAWLGHTGITYPQPFSDKGIDWLRTFGGGLCTTCGLSHVGGPESDEYGDRGIHGLISNIPAELESIIQPDPLAGRMDMSITGTMRETKIFGPGFELKRTISGRLGEAIIHIHDEIINRSNTPAPHMILYHFNFGWPLVDEGTRLIWEGQWQLRNPERNGNIFHDEHDFRTCPAPIENHLGTGEAVACIDITANSRGECICGLFNANLGWAVAIRFNKSELPWLTNWQHWGKNEYVTGLEPGTHRPIGQAAARKNNELLFILPGEKKTYDLRLEVIHDTEKMNDLINKK